MWDVKHVFPLCSSAFLKRKPEENKQRVMILEHRYDYGTSDMDIPKPTYLVQHQPSHIEEVVSEDDLMGDPWT